MTVRLSGRKQNKGDIQKHTVNTNVSRYSLIWFRYMVLDATFNNFIDAGSRSTLWKPPSCRESQANFITYCCIEYTSLLEVFELTTLVVIDTDYEGSLYFQLLSDHDHDGPFSIRWTAWKFKY